MAGPLPSHCNYNHLWARRLIGETAGALHPGVAGPNPAASTNLCITDITRRYIKQGLSQPIRLANPRPAYCLINPACGLNCQQIQVDEIWGFIGSKNKNAQSSGHYGGVWTFIALDAETKLIPSFIVGKRDTYHAHAFMEDLAGRLSRRVQLTSDAMKAYPEAVERGFGSEVDYAQLVKTYSVTHLGKSGLPAAVRYSPAEVVKTEKTIVNGMPDVSRITTSHVEKQNHTLRMHCRRLSRLTNAFSKKFENFQAAVSLNFAYYNFCKTHGALKMTPAMAAGIETTFWTVEDLVKRCGE